MLAGKSRRIVRAKRTCDYFGVRHGRVIGATPQRLIPRDAEGAVTVAALLYPDATQVILRYSCETPALIEIACPNSVGFLAGSEDQGASLGETIRRSRPSSCNSTGTASGQLSGGGATKANSCRILARSGMCYTSVNRLHYRQLGCQIVRCQRTCHLGTERNACDSAVSRWP